VYHLSFLKEIVLVVECHYRIKKASVCTNRIEVADVTCARFEEIASPVL